MSRYIIGTVQQLQDKLTLNGVVLGQVELSVMTRVLNGSLFKQIGIIEREGKRGRPSVVWQVDTDKAAFFECADATGLAVNDDEAPAYVKVA
jgi:hypothetical protein